MNAAPSKRPTILIFATGGTIAMHDTGNGLEPDPDFAHTLESAAASICERLQRNCRINHLQPAIDSANATAETAPKIARQLRARVNAMQASAVVITHGTDTMAYIAARLAFELAHLRVPIIITGSQLPLRAAASDAQKNLALAITAAAKAANGSPLAIACGGQLLPAVRATKSDASSFTAFRAERALAANPSGLAPIARDLTPRSTAARVISFRFTPGVIAADLLHAVAGAPEGLVLESYGAGNAPLADPALSAALTAICQRLPVVQVTQCAKGTVDSSRYAVGRQLAACGVIAGGDLTLEAAIAKLGFLLDSGVAKPDIAQLMQTNLLGEITMPDHS